MKLSKIHALWFSGTGTTEKVVRTIAAEMAKRLSVPVETVDFTTPAGREAVSTFAEDELTIVGTPVYAGRVPNVLLPYLTEKLKGGGGPAIPVVLYGNRNFDDGLIELRNLLQENNFRTIAAAGFIGEHSFSRVLAAGRPDQADLAIVTAFAQQAAEKLERMEGLPDEPVQVRGETPLRPYYKPRDRQGSFINILKVKPVTDMEKCDNCGLCAKLCPMGSIDVADVSNIKGICIKCCACVKKCHKDAKYFTDEGYLYHRHELEEGYARRAEPELFF